MLVDSSNSAAGSTVTGAIRQASQATGTSFNYLLATAQVESGLDPQAGASTSSARGLFQFVEQTWLGTMKQPGPTLGYGRYADAITKTASGHYEVKDPAMRSEILKLRNDPTANAVMAGAFTKANAAMLTDKLGRAPSEGELYIAHFLGAGGAARLISLAASNPNAKADEFLCQCRARQSLDFLRPNDRRAAQPRAGARYSHGPLRRGALEAGRPAATAQARPSFPVLVDITPAGSVAVAVRCAGSARNAAMPVPDTAGITNAFAAACRGQACGHEQPDLPWLVSGYRPHRAGRGEW